MCVNVLVARNYLFMQIYKHWPSSAHGLATRIGAKDSVAQKLLEDIQRYYPYQKALAVDCLNFVISSLVMEEWPARLKFFVTEHPPKQERGAVVWRVVRAEEQFNANYDLT
jgi:hypothetical protein